METTSLLSDQRQVWLQLHKSAREMRISHKKRVFAQSRAAKSLCDGAVLCSSDTETPHCRTSIHTLSNNCKQKLEMAFFQAAKQWVTTNPELR